MRRTGDWMQTYTGVEFYPLDPRPEEIRIEDIAHALAYTCRFSGHCNKFYSVAEHSVMVAQAAPTAHKMAALMHDASEAYLSDIIRPIKKHILGYGPIEDKLMLVIADKYHFKWPMDPEVHRLDNAILADERDQIMSTPPRDWGLTEPGTGLWLPCWTPCEAEDAFLGAFRDYSK